MFQVGGNVYQEFNPANTTVQCKPIENVDIEKCTTSISVRDKARNEKENPFKTSIDTGASGDYSGRTSHGSCKRKNPPTRSLKTRTKKISRGPCKPRSLFLIGDSHVRHLEGLVNETLLDNAKITVRFRGGASLLQICNYLKDSVSKDDHIFVLGGTNDIERNSLTKLKPCLLKLLKTHPQAKVTFILVPLRAHWNREYYQNNSILKFNEDLIRMLRKEHAHLNFLDINQILHAGHYIKDGLHLNLDGKIELAMAIGLMFNNS